MEHIREIKPNQEGKRGQSLFFLVAACGSATHRSIPPTGAKSTNRSEPVESNRSPKATQLHPPLRVAFIYPKGKSNLP